KVTIPKDLQGLVKKFEAERAAFLGQQRDLFAKLKNATTPEQRAAIRASLQQNRDDFLTVQKEFRQDLKLEITQLKDTLNNTQIDRLLEEIQAAINAHHHHGKT